MQSSAACADILKIISPSTTYSYGVVLRLDGLSAENVPFLFVLVFRTKSMINAFVTINLFDLGFINGINLFELVGSSLVFVLIWTDNIFLGFQPFCRIPRSRHFLIFIFARINWLL